MRMRRGGLFLAIVWSVAGAFQVIFYGAPLMLDRAVDASRLADASVIPRPARPGDCRAAVGRILALPRAQAGSNAPATRQ